MRRCCRPGAQDILPAAQGLDGCMHLFNSLVWTTHPTALGALTWGPGHQHRCYGTLYAAQL
jgi:hypothetical protein